jgi:single-strand DNA-binding protein
MNSVNLVGRLTKDPELQERGESQVCDMRIAVNGQGDAPALFIDVAAFGKQGAACARYLGKGSQVSVSGSLRFARWEADGQPRSKHSVLASQVQFLDSRSNSVKAAEEQDEPAAA